MRNPPGRARRQGARIALLSAAIASTPATAAAQNGDGGGTATIDTIIIERQNLFTVDSAGGPFRTLMNQLHTTTRPFVIRRELLFEPGAPYDSSLLAESERNLRSTGLFRSVRVDTTRVDGRLAAHVRTKDAWSIIPRTVLRIASDGTLTGSVGATETNVAGTGNRVRLWYVREADRDGVILSGRIPRIGRSRHSVAGSWANLSDLGTGSWSLAYPFRSFSDRFSVFYGGEAFSGRVLQYRTEAPGVRDTTEWRRRAFVNRGFVTFAPLATPERYIRIGFTAEIRREEYLRVVNRALDLDSVFSLVPDTLYGQFGLFAEYRRARFSRMDRFNGFTDEDQDLSDLAFVQVSLAPGGLGYRSTGVGARIVLGSGARAGPVILKASVDANALFRGAGIDSGRVVASGTIGIKSGVRQATFLEIGGGLLDSPSPGSEFDLGFEIFPRLWGPHAFVGTRSVRLTLEHRVFVFDNILDVAGMGVAAFLDYGGAWYEDQDRRFGGDTGLSLFFGSPLGSLAQISHFGAGYRFGGGIGTSGASRWAVTLGSGIIF